MNTYTVGAPQHVGAALWPRMLILALALLLTAPFAVANSPARTQALAALEAGEAERAIEILERAIRTERNNAELHYLLGVAEVAHIGSRSALGQMRAAGRMRRAWERAVELDPDHVQARFSLMGYYAQAPGIAGGDKSKARAEAVEIGRRDVVMGHRANATLAAMDSDFPAAVAELQQAVAKAPSDPETLTPLLGELGFMCQRAEDWACAHDAFSRAVIEDPEFMMGWYQIGRTALNAGEKIDEGIAALNHYLAHDPTGNNPSLAWAHTRVSELHLLNDDQQQARAHVQQALTLDANHEQAQALMARLDACGRGQERSC